MKKLKAKRIFKTVGMVFCALVMLVSTLSAVLLAWIQGTIFCEEFFVNACDEVYLQELESFLLENLTGELARYEESQEVQNRLAKQCIDMDAVALCSRDHLRSLYQALVNGTELTDVQYPKEHFAPFRQHVELVSEEAGDEVSQEVLDELVEGFAARVSSDINCFHFNLLGVSSSSLIRMANEKLFANASMKGLLSISFWIPVAVGLASAAGLFFLSSRKELVGKLYVTLSCFWVAVSILFFPVILFSVYDLPSRLAITASPVKSLLDRLLYHLIDAIAVPVSLVFAMASLGILICIVLQLRSYAKKLKEREQQAREDASVLMVAESLAEVPLISAETAEEEKGGRSLPKRVLLSRRKPRPRTNRDNTNQ